MLPSGLEGESRNGLKTVVLGGLLSREPVIESRLVLIAYGSPVGRPQLEQKANHHYRQDRKYYCHHARFLSIACANGRMGDAGDWIGRLPMNQR
jgi:hypothetical protein